MTPFHKGILIDLSLGVLLLGGVPSLVYAQDTTTAAAREVVESYARVEFEGGNPDEREKIIRFSPKRKAQIEKQTGMWAYVDYSSYQHIVVSSYKVGDIKITGSRATAQFDYRRLAHSEGDTDNTRHFIAEAPHDETVTLNLVFDKKQWWVIDPPTTRVSKQMLIEGYEATIKDDRESGWLTQPNLSAHQKTGYDRDVENLQILKSLP